MTNNLSKIMDDYTQKSYFSFLKNELGNDRPIAAPKIIKVRVINKNDNK